MIKCGECGYENMDGLDYCDGCGAKLNGAASASAGSSPAPSVPSAAPAAEAAAPPAESAAAGPTESTPAAVAPAEGAAEVPSSEAPTGEIKAPEPAGEVPAQPAAAAAPAPFKAKLSILRGGRKGQEFELEAGKNFVGRWDPDTGSFPEVDLDADDPEAKISRRHALVIIEGGKITIEDIGSLNGTYVNRQPRLAPGTPVELKNGDEIIIGKTFLKLVVDTIS